MLFTSSSLGLIKFSDDELGVLDGDVTCGTATVIVVVVAAAVVVVVDVPDAAGKVPLDLDFVSASCSEDVDEESVSFILILGVITGDEGASAGVDTDDDGVTTPAGNAWAPPCVLPCLLILLDDDAGGFIKCAPVNDPRALLVLLTPLLLPLASLIGLMTMAIGLLRSSSSLSLKSSVMRPVLASSSSSSRLTEEIEPPPAPLSGMGISVSCSFSSWGLVPFLEFSFL